MGKIIESIALVLVTLGALNWGFVGVFGIDVVAVAFGSIAFATTAVYALIGLAGLYYAYVALKHFKGE